MKKVDLEAAEKLAAGELAHKAIYKKTIHDLVAEVRRLQHNKLTSDHILADMDEGARMTAAERDEARRQLADLNASYKGMGVYYEAQLAVAREALSDIAMNTESVFTRDDAREALAKIGGSDG